MKITRKTHNIPIVILSMLVVLLGGLLTLCWQEQQRQISHAAGDVVVGPPSVPATAVDALFTRLGSPMVGTGRVVEEASRKTNIDDAFALAVWWAETNDGMAGVGRGYHNPGGVQASPNYPRNGYTIYPSYAAAVTDWFNIVQSRYINRGLTSVYTIAYPYVGTSGAPTWANKVMNYMTSYRALSPPPTPTPVVTQTPVPTPAVVVKPETSVRASIASLKKADQRQVASSSNATSTQWLLGGLGLLTTLLLAVPVFLIHRKRRALGKALTPTSVSSLTFEPEQATNSLPVTTTLRMEAISGQQLKPLYMNQYSPVLEGGEVNAINISQLAFEFDVLPAIPVSPSSTQPLANGPAAVPPTPLYRVPATPLFRRIPATPLLSHNSQGGLLTRYNTNPHANEQISQGERPTQTPHNVVSQHASWHNMPSRPRRIELTRSPDAKIVTHHKRETEPQSDANP
jgi:hypothetical protein